MHAVHHQTISTKMITKELSLTSFIDIPVLSSHEAVILVTTETIFVQLRNLFVYFGNMSATIEFPIVCYTDEDMNVIVPLVTKWYIDNQALHFNALTHLNTECGMHKQMVSSGQQPTIKVIYIAKHLRQAAKIIIKQLRSHFPDSSDEDSSDDEEQLQREGKRNLRLIMMCPVCGLNFGDQ